MTLFEILHAEAVRLGLDDLGIVSADRSESFDSFCDWLDSGRGATLDYLQKNREARRHPSSVFPKVRTLLIAVISLDHLVREDSSFFDFPGLIEKTVSSCNSEKIKAGYKKLLEYGFENSVSGSSENSTFGSANRLEGCLGNISKESYLELSEASKQNSDKKTEKVEGQIIPYAIVTDYHFVLRERLNRLFDFFKEIRPEVEGRVVVDTAPLPEKEWAVRAGLGRPGRHSLLIHPEAGCSIFLGTLLVSLDFDEFGIVPRTLPKSDFCSGCCRCMQSCPTGAIGTDRRIDARKCLNFWTIENRSGEVPEEIRQAIGDRLFGCDDCARICPWNGRNSSIPSIGFDLSVIESLSNSQFKRELGRTPLARVGLAGLKRNAEIVRCNAETQQVER